MLDLALVEQQQAVGVAPAQQAAGNTVDNRQPRQLHSGLRELYLGREVRAAATVDTCCPNLEEDTDVEEAGHQQQDGEEELRGVLG